MAGKVHVVFGESAMGSLAEALILLGDSSPIVCIADNLCVGPLVDTPDHTRADWLRQELGLKHAARAPHEDSVVVSRLKDDDSRLVVWTSRRVDRDGLGLLFIASRIPRPFEVVDLTDITVSTSPPDRGPSRRRPAESLSVLAGETIVTENLVGLARPFGPIEASAALEAWHLLEQENARLRIVIDGVARSVDESFFDVALLAHADEHWRKMAHVVGYTMSDDDMRGIPDSFYAGRLRKLIHRGRLEARGDLGQMRSCEVRRPPSRSDGP